MVRELELKVLEMCEEILPKTQYAHNKKLQNLLQQIRKHLEGDK